MSTFDGSKVNGLANALQSQMSVNNPIDSEALFEWFKLAVPSALKYMKPNKLRDAIQEMPDGPFTYCTPLLQLTIGYCEYDTENNVWNTEVKKSVGSSGYDGKLGAYYVPVYMVEPLSANSAIVKAVLGKYMYLSTLTIETNSITISDEKFVKIAI